jgi:hypothetical protein
MSMTRRDVAAAVGAALATGLVFRSGTAQAACPRIHDAIDKLNGVVGELQAAAKDYGGHKAAAIQACQGALTQLGYCLSSTQCNS